MSEAIEKTPKELLDLIYSTMYPGGLHWDYSKREHDFITECIQKLRTINDGRVSPETERTRQKLSVLQRSTDEIYGTVKKNVNREFSKQEFYSSLSDLRGRGCFGIVDSW